MRQQGSINREDMLELTRRMTLKRHCFSRICGAYFDDEGYVDGTFNRHFQKLTAPEQQKQLDIAKQILFSDTNTKVTEYRFEESDAGKNSMWQLLMALKSCELKNDALLDILYSIIGERYSFDGDYALYLYYGSYDVPRKGSDHAEQWESEEVYSFLIGAVCPASSDFEPEAPVSGFLFPAFRDRSGDSSAVNIYHNKGQKIIKIFEQKLTEALIWN